MSQQSQQSQQSIAEPARDHRTADLAEYDQLADKLDREPMGITYAEWQRMSVIAQRWEILGHLGL